MNTDTIANLLRDILSGFAPEANLDDLDPDVMLQDALDIDSMDFLNAMIAVHEQTGVDIPESDYGDVATFAGLVRYVSARAAS